jgi:hypothetical protein
MLDGPLLKNTLLLTLAAIVAGCATSAQPPASRTLLDTLTTPENLPGKPACFWKSSFQGDWTVLNDSTLIVHAPLPQDSYVIKLFAPVFGLAFKEELGLEDRAHSGQFCSNGAVYLLVPGWQPPQVPIDAIHALTRDQEDQLLRAAGKPIPHAHRSQTPAVAPPPAAAPQ